MKKSLVSLACLTAFAPVAQAQSSIALFGIIDEGLVYQTNAKTGGANTAASPNVGGKKIFVDVNTALAGDRWGLMGSEDLGGGLKAIFLLENGFNLNTGALAQGGLEFGRQAFMGLSSNQYGKLTLGRQYETIHDYVGPLIFSTQIGSAMAALPGDVDNAQGTQRVNNSIKYTSIDYRGFGFTGLYSLGGVAGSAGRNQVYSLGMKYTTGPVLMVATLLKANNPNISYFSNSAIAANTLGSAQGSVTAASNPIFGGYTSASSFQSAVLGGAYVFSNGRFDVTYSNVRFAGLQSSLSGFTPSATGPKGTAMFNAATANFTWFWTPAWATGIAYSCAHGSSVSFGKLLANGSYNTGGANYRQLSLSTDYLLSKRTDLSLVGVYQTASGIDSTGTSATAMANNLTPSANNHQAAVRLGLRTVF